MVRILTSSIVAATLAATVALAFHDNLLRWVEPLFSVKYGDDSGIDFANPERGLYKRFVYHATHAWGSSDALDPATMQDLRETSQVTLIQRIYYIQEFVDNEDPQPLGEGFLASLRKILRTQQLPASS